MAADSFKALHEEYRGETAPRNLVRDLVRDIALATKQREARDLVAAIGHIDAAIRAFDPDADIEYIKPKLPPRFQAFKGEVSRLVLDALRKERKPMPISDLTLIAAAGRAINADDKEKACSNDPITRQPRFVGNNRTQRRRIKQEQGCLISPNSVI